MDDVAPAHDDPPLSEGTEIEGYIVDGVVGRGGMGVVYSATHPVIGKRCAVKVLRADISNNPVTVERFIQEARAVNQIGHPNIIDIFDFGTLPDGRHYHLMDLLVGESLRHRLRRGPLHPSEAASVIEGIASALLAAHDKGFIHRDLKPDNIYLCPTDGSEWPVVKLLDFGLAKLMPEAGIAPFVTKTGLMLGTPEYMSPEQARGDGVDYRTDIYALGILMFEILTGQRPFPSGFDSYSTLQYHVEEEPPSVGTLIPELPAEMVQLVDAMLAKDPKFRPSLTAVRTVIKRLRTTALPTRSVAGLEMRSISRRLQSPLTITPSRVGAEPLVDEPLPPHLREPSIPIALAGVPLDSLRPPPDPAPMFLSPSTAIDIPDVPPDVAPPVAAPAPAPAPALAAPGTVERGTKLGVPPPPKLPSTTGPQPVPVTMRSSKTWIIVGAILAIAAGVAAGFAILGT